MNGPGTATSEECMRSHVPDAIGLMFRILRLSVVWLARLGQCLACFTFLPEGVTQREPTAAPDIDTLALPRLLDRLEKADYIRRRFDPTDRHLRRIFLTGGVDWGVRSHAGGNRQYYPSHCASAMRRIRADASRGYQRCTSTLRNYLALGAGVVT